MNSIDSIRQDMLARMEAMKGLSQGAGIRPAAEPQGFTDSFAANLRAIDAQQHQSSSAVAAVERGQSDDLLGAMVDSQKASVAFSALLQVRNKLSTAFDDIIKMPL